MPLQQQDEGPCNRPSTLLTVEDINLNTLSQSIDGCAEEMIAE